MSGSMKSQQRTAYSAILNISPYLIFQRFYD